MSQIALGHINDSILESVHALDDAPHIGKYPQEKYEDTKKGRCDHIRIDKPRPHKGGIDDIIGTVGKLHRHNVSVLSQNVHAV